jgi:hypothetical protein
MTEQRLAARALAAQACMPLGHMARLRGVELEAEAVPHLPFLRQYSRDKRFLARLQAHGVHVDES